MSVGLQSRAPQLLHDETTAGSLAVHRYEPGVTAMWDEFVINQPHGTFFHLTGWMRVIERTFGFKPCYFYVERAGKITGIVPLFLVENWLVGRCFVSTPFAVYGGICAEDPVSELALLNHLLEFARERGCDYLELRRQEGGIYPQFHGNPLYSTFSKELLSDVDQNFKRLPNDTRYMIRRAGRAGLTARRGPDQMEIFQRLFSTNMHRHGTPMFPRRFFRNLESEFGDKLELLIVYLADEPISGVMSFFFRDSVLPYYAGIGGKANKLGANNFMYWEIMKHAAESGCRYFDFGRSKKGTGAFFFKTQWNMEVRDLDYQVFLVRRKTPPNFSPVNPKFKTATQLWQKLPLWGANLLGPHVVKWFP
jgi:FemAB-related protein (PEP-CTERM system-associated)